MLAGSQSLQRFVSGPSGESEPTPEARYRGRFTRLDIRFRGALCYIDAYLELDSEVAVHLCRLRYFRNDGAWSMAFYTYSHDKYQPCVFGNGKWHGTPEEAFDIGAMYLQ